jgi:hypothetical protein
VFGAHEDLAVPAACPDCKLRVFGAGAFCSPPVGGSPAAVTRSGTALGAGDAAFCANGRTQTARGVCRTRRNIRSGERETP